MTQARETREGTAERIARTRPAALFGLLFMAGCVMGGPVRGISGYAFLALGAALVLGAALYGALSKERVVSLVCAAALLLGCGRYVTARDARPQVQNAYNASVTGTVADDPAYKGDRLVFRLDGVALNGEEKGFSARVYVREGEEGQAALSYGDRIELTGHFWQAHSYANPGTFDFGEYLWRQGEAGYVTCTADEVEVTGRGGSAFLRLVYSARSALRARIGELFSEENRPLALALVVGDRTGLDDALRSSFADSGIAHVLAVSGLHISVTAAAAMAVLALIVPKKAAFAATLACVTFYAFVTGMQPSVVRALIMYALAGSAGFFGETSDPLTRIGIAAFVMLSVKPLYAADAGFLLSFGACCGIVLLEERTERLLGIGAVNAIRVKWLRSLLAKAVSLVSLTLCCQAAALPVIADTYGTLPLVGIAWNVLLVPVAVAAYILSLAGVALRFPAPAADMLLTALRRGAAMLASVPGSSVPLPDFPGWLCLLYYAGLFALSGLVRPRRAVRAAAAAACAACVAYAYLLSMPDTKGVSVLCFDAGQANCALVNAQGHYWMVDAGAGDTPAAAWLEKRGIEPDGIILTHPDKDHAGGLAAILDGAKCKRVLIPLYWDEVEDTDESVTQGIDRAREMGIPVESLQAGDGMRLSPDAELRVLAPSPGGPHEGSNEISLVLELRYGKCSFVFMGDVPMRCEPANLPDCDCLMVAHHGSSSSTSMLSLRQMTPSAAVISVGRNTYGHPSDKVLEKLELAGTRVFRTDRSGAVTVRMHEDGRVTVSTYR